MKAKTIEQYEQAWQSHINQLATLALAADIPYKQYSEVKHTLEFWLEEAVINQRNNFGDEHE